MTNLRDELLAIAKRLELAIDFPPAVLAEVEALIADPGIDDPSLVDRTALPLVTIDGETSKDLDQALHVGREGDGYLISYAIADASHYVKPKSALFEEAMRRGATYYFPGWSVPMLPRPLSEGLVSLNPDGPRRALLFLHRLDSQGELISTTLERARVHSKAKLSFGGVQRFVDGTDTSHRGAAFEESLFLLREVGQKRMKLAADKGHIRYRREEVTIQLDGEGISFAVMEAARDEVELWNEQISLLCNAEGGRLLREHPSPAVQPIYRVHGGPAPERLEELSQLTEALARAHGLPENPWCWAPSRQSLAEYLDGLPHAESGSLEDRLVRAISRQAVMVNLRSEYSIEAGPHFGVGAEPYARFSAPMREMVGVFLHKEAVEMLTGVHPSVEEDEALRARVVEVANQSRTTQRTVQDAANELVLDKIFRPEVSKPFAERTRMSGVVMGITSGKIHVRLDHPPIDVKLYMRDLAKAFDNAWLEPAELGAVLRKKETGEVVLKLADRVTLCIARRDDAQRRWVLALV